MILRKLPFMIAVICLGTALSACSAPAVPLSPAAAGVTQGESEQMEKYNAYVMLNNLMRGRIDEVLIHYFEKFGTEKQPVIEDNFSFIMLGVVEQDRAVIDQAKGFIASKPAFASADPAAAKLIPAIQDLLAVLDGMKVYYDSKGYVDDDFAKGKELHAKLLAAYEAYDKSAQDYYTALQKMGDEQRLADLQEFKNAGQDIRYNALKFMIDAEATAMEIEAQGIHAANVLELDLAKFKAKYDVMTADLTALTTLSKDKDQIQKEGLNEFSIGSYVQAATEAKVGASNIIERIKNKEPVSDSDLSGQFLDSTEGTPETFNQLIGKAVERYNGM
ncbi:YiiG family protein [Saccharibacillus deserti]|uniref:YiiG family protein n=1 Tax=Saccharibacillus deserti TaxID=1634444 RepID=UPI0031B5E60F